MEDKKLGTEQANELINSIVGTIDTFVKTEVKNLKDRVEQDLQDETSWRKASIQKVDAKLNKETEYRIKDVDNEKLRAQTVEGNLLSLKTDNKTTLVDSINSEVDRAISVEGDLHDLQTESKDNLVSSINSEKSRAETAEQSLLNRSIKIAEWSSNNDSPTLKDVVVNSLLGMEINERQKLDSKLDSAIDAEQKARDGEDKAIKQSIEKESSTRSKDDGDLSTLKIGTQSSLVDAINAEYDERVSEVTRVDDRIDKEIRDRQAADLLDVKLSSAEQQTINSNILLSGQLTVDGEIVSGSSTVVGNLTISAPITTFEVDGSSDGGNLIVEGKAEINGGLSVLNDTTVQNGAFYVKGATSDKDISIIDGTIHAKDITVDGTLNVLGETITTLNKTLEVDDNVIVTRANATTSPVDNSGLVISVKNTFDSDGNRTSNKSVGIVYNPINDSVDLAIGSLVSDEYDNKFNATESNPIVIRPNSSDVNNNNFIIWEKIEKEYENGVKYQSVRAIDSGKSISDFTQAQEDISRLKSDLQAETENRTNTDSDIYEKLEAEQQTRIGADETLQENINKEVSRAQAEELSLSNKIVEEETRAMQEEDDLSGRITDEVNDRISSDNQINTRIDGIDGQISSLQQTDASLQKQINDEVQARISQDGKTLSDSKKYTDGETGRAQIAEQDLQKQINDLAVTIRDQVKEEMQPILDELEESADILKVDLQQHMSSAQEKIESIELALQSEISQRGDEDADIRQTISDLSQEIKNRYDPSKSFYESFLSIAQANPNKLIAPIYNSENSNYEWKVVTMDDGEIS